MEYVYVVVDNGEAYPLAYKVYKDAVHAVKEKYKNYIEEQIKDIGDLESIEKILADINVHENPLGKSFLYIEKGINIVIHKLTIST
jgi:hypothetical protein